MLNNASTIGLLTLTLLSGCGGGGSESRALQAGETVILAATQNNSGSGGTCVIFQEGGKTCTASLTALSTAHGTVSIVGSDGSACTIETNSPLSIPVQLGSVVTYRVSSPSVNVIFGVASVEVACRPGLIPDASGACVRGTSHYGNTWFLVKDSSFSQFTPSRRFASGAESGKLPINGTRYSSRFDSVKQGPKLDDGRQLFSARHLDLNQTLVLAVDPSTFIYVIYEDPIPVGAQFVDSRPGLNFPVWITSATADDGITCFVRADTTVNCQDASGTALGNGGPFYIDVAVKNIFVLEN
jgi:hypothetical protein